MGIALGLTLFIVFLSVGIYIVFLLRHHIEIHEVNRGVFPEEERLNGRAIIEVTTYKETKTEMSRMRAALDEVVDIYDRLSQGQGDCRGNKNEDEVVVTIPKLYAAIIDLRFAAETLLAAVKRKSQGWNKEIFNDYSVLRIPEDSSDSPAGSSMNVQSLQAVGECLSLIGPSIAGFYFAMTDSDESTIVERAATEVQNIIDNIDVALDALPKNDP